MRRERPGWRSTATSAPRSTSPRRKNSGAAIWAIGKRATCAWRRTSARCWARAQASVRWSSSAPRTRAISKPIWTRCTTCTLSTPTRCCADRARALVPERGLHDTPRLGGGLALGEGVDMLHAFAHLAPDGVLAVEKACVVERSEEHTSELQSLLRISYAVFCLK